MLKAKTKKQVLSIFFGILVLIAVLIFSGITSFAATNGEYEYELLDDGTAEIISYWGNDTILNIPSKLDGHTITSIGYLAFSSSPSLSITIPNSITNIGNNAFMGCKSLTSVNIPNSVTNIGDEAFSYCYALENVYYIGSMAEWQNILMGYNTFLNSDNATIYCEDKSPYFYYKVLNNGTAEITGYYGEDDNLVIPSSIDGYSVTSIGRAAFCDASDWDDNWFYGDLSLRKVTIPNSVTSIGSYAFFGCSNLTNITIPNSVTNIGGGAFEYCKSLKSINIPNSVKTIENNTFYGCCKLTNISIPNSVISIGGYAFYGCSNLTSIYILNKNCNMNNYEYDYDDCSKYDVSNKTIPTTTTIYGYKGSTAEAYAKKYNRSFKAIDEEKTSLLNIPKISSVSSTATGIKITWGKVTGAAKYRVFYKTGNGKWTKLTDTTSTSYTWTKAKSNTKYTFTVRCISKDGKSYTSDYNKTGKNIKYIAAPKLSSVTNTTTGVKISWGKVAGAAKYRIFYKTGNGKWKKLTDTTSTSYTWKKAKSGTKYSFTVRCISKDGKSYTSAYDTKGKSITFVSAPKISKLSKTSSGIKISWGKVAGAAKYRIFYKTANGKWKKLTDTTSTSYTWKGAKKGTTYNFTVRCISKDGKTYTSAYDTKGKSIKR